MLSGVVVITLFLGCGGTFYSHEGPIYVLHTELMNLRDFLVLRLAENENLLHTLHDGQNINEGPIIEPLVGDQRKYLGLFKEVKILNGVFTDSTGQKLVIQIVPRKVDNQSKNKRDFDIRIWSLGKNGIDEGGLGDDINSWEFPK